MKYLIFAMQAILFFSFVTSAQTSEVKPCYQSTSLKSELTKEAELQDFNVRYIEIVGNRSRSGRDFFKRLGPIINEGDIFKARNLEAALVKLSRMKSIRPLTNESVKIDLNREEKAIDISICVVEKPKLR